MARKSITTQRDTRFIGDTHFCHGMMLEFRKHDSVDAMDEAMIQAWNSVVHRDTVVYHLGDFGLWKPRLRLRLKEIFDRLNGRKILVAGNHDDEHVASTEFGWEAVHHGSVHLLDHVTDTKIILGHHPQREWDGWHNGSVHLHGHTHGNLPSSNRSLDVGVDSIGMTPLSFPQLQAKMATLPDLDFRGQVVRDVDLAGGRKALDVTFVSFATTGELHIIPFAMPPADNLVTIRFSVDGNVLLAPDADTKALRRLLGEKSIERVVTHSVDAADELEGLLEEVAQAVQRRVDRINHVGETPEGFTP